MARRIPLPSFLSTKRSKVITVATAGTLALAAGVSAAVVAFPSSSSPVPATADAAFMTAVGQQASAQTARPAAAATQPAALSKQARALQAKRFEQQVATVKATANAVAAHKAAAAAAARRAAAQQTAAQAAVSVASGSPEQVAEQMLSQFGWSPSQFSCLQPLWQQESGWSLTAENPSSGAYGIPQALPGSQMASAGPDWQTNAATQIRWGLTYIQSRYGSPCGAWAHEEADGWY